MTDSRVLRYARLFNYGDCYSGIYWADVFDGTYDRMQPEGGWFDPIGIWTQRYFDLIHRPADPGALRDPVRELFLQTVLDAGHTLDEVTEKALAAFARDLFILLRSEAHNALEVLPEHVFVLYRELVHTDPAPSVR